MARRSPQNERYQKNTAPAGKTRRSSASAKPKREAEQTGSSAPKKKPAAARQPLVINPPTEEFRRWRRIWWMLLLGSVVFTFASLAVRQWLGQPQIANILLFIGYAGIFAALYLDWTKLRRMRKEWMDLQKSGKAPKPDSKPVEKTNAESSKKSSARDES
ncbi:MAG TPA: hypothetical protein VLA05_01115 [Coriobacteriia bacterium]|nr:hypothetical protein [Coriobacteriia bacterium]